MPDSITAELVRRVAALEKRAARLEEAEHPPWQKGCRVYRSTTQAISNNTVTPISFDTEVYVTDSCWAIADPTKMFAGHAGYYIAGGQMNFAPAQLTAVGEVLIAVRADGTKYKAQQQLYIETKAQYVGLSVATGMFWLAEGGYVEIVVRHITGIATVNLSLASANNQQFNNGWIARVA
jgi:hypothetical protein